MRYTSSTTSCFIEDHPISSAFKFGYFSEQLGVQGQDHYYRPLLTASFLLENKLWGIQERHPAPDQPSDLPLSAGVPSTFFLKPAVGVSLFSRDRHASLRPLSAQHGQHRLGGRTGRPADVPLGHALSSLPRSLAHEAPRHLSLPLVGQLSLGHSSPRRRSSFSFPSFILYEAIKRKKISPALSSGQPRLLSAVFFFLKNLRPRPQECQVHPPGRHRRRHQRGLSVPWAITSGPWSSRCALTLSCRSRRP